MVIWVLVSSRQTMASAGTAAMRAHHAARCSGRCSVAIRLFFARQAVTLQDAAGRGAADDQPVLGRELRAIFVQGGVGTGGDLGHEQPLLLRRESPGRTGTGCGREQFPLADAGTPATVGNEH